MYTNKKQKTKKTTTIYRYMLPVQSCRKNGGLQFMLVNCDNARVCTIQYLDNDNYNLFKYHIFGHEL